MKYSSDTIVAQATPPGRGGIAIIRVSGPMVQEIAQHILHTVLKPRYATYTPFLDENAVCIDEGIALFFPQPHSFTGEDVLELQGHGGPAVCDMLISRITQLGARMAKPGEFSERAFLNDKLDLVKAEAIADLIQASSQQAAKSALRSLQGEFSQRINQLVEKLTYLRMYVEASIDFVEEEIDFLQDRQIHSQLANALADFSDIVKKATQGSLLREGITVVIAGKPNVGKSSLLNTLSGKNTAIVTDIAGTTRDLLRENILLDGMPLHIIDTAGLRTSDDPVEQEGIRRARIEMAAADIILSVTDVTQPEDRPDADLSSYDAAEIILIRNKIDKTHESPSCEQINQQTVISLSAATGIGIDLLKDHIRTKVGFEKNIEGSFSARRRHLDALERAKHHLSHAHAQLAVGAGETFAEDLRQAQLALSEITGEFSSEDLLGRIFSSFCIGK